MMDEYFQTVLHSRIVILSGYTIRWSELPICSFSVEYCVLFQSVWVHSIHFYSSVKPFCALIIPFLIMISMCILIILVFPCMSVHQSFKNWQTCCSWQDWLVILVFFDEIVYPVVFIVFNIIIHFGGQNKWTITKDVGVLFTRLVIMNSALCVLIFVVLRFHIHCVTVSALAVEHDRVRMFSNVC